MSQQKNYPHNITGGLSRRSFLQSGLILGGSLVLPLNLFKLKSAQAASSDMVEINDWVRISPNGSIILGLSQAESGQGVYTGLPQILADALDINWQDVSVEFVTGRDAYRVIGAGIEVLSQFVGGSMSVVKFHDRLVQAGSEARTLFLLAAAEKTV